MDTCLSVLSGNSTLTQVLSTRYLFFYFLSHIIVTPTMRIALEQSADPLPILEQVLKMNEALEKEGFGDCGTQAMIHSYRKS